MQKLSWRTPNGYEEDVQALYQALSRPGRTPRRRRSSRCARSSAGQRRTSRTPARRTDPRSAGRRWRRPRRSCFDPAVDFPVEDEAVSHARQVAERGKACTRSGRLFAAWAQANPERKALFDRLAVHGLPAGWAEAMPVFPADGRAWRPARRRARSCPRSPRCCQNCGAARPTWPNPTSRRWRASRRSVPVEHQTKMWPGNPYGRTLHFGIREHGMGSILNGIALHGGTRPYGGHLPGVQRLHASRPSGSPR